LPTSTLIYQTGGESNLAGKQVFVPSISMPLL
jgi:hypothetical protein